ncbi:MAG: hypothetical protein ABW101_06530 [Candidatus Thiodiazotropha sp.]
MDKPLTIRMYRVCWIVWMIFFGVFPATQAAAATPPRVDTSQDPMAVELLNRGVPFSPLSDEPFSREGYAVLNHPGSLKDDASRAMYEPRIPFLAEDSSNALYLESEWRMPGSQRLASANPEPSMDRSAVVAEVPLPAAIWLFGSALIGFVSFSARRSI